MGGACCDKGRGVPGRGRQEGQARWSKARRPARDGATTKKARRPATRGCSSAWCYRRQRQGSSRLGGRARDVTTWRINSAGPGRVESGLPMKTKTHFAFRIDVWDETGVSIVEHVAGVADFEVAE